MSAFTALTLNTKVYSPSSYINGIAQWTERSSEYSAGFSSLTEKVWQATNGGQAGAYHSQSKLKLPVVATVDSTCSCAGTLLGESWIDTHVSVTPSMDAAARLDLYNRYVAFVATDAFKKSITDLEPVIGS